MFGFYKYYFVAASLLLIIELLIGLYLHDAIIRPYGGDFLVVILIYCFVKSFVNRPVLPVAACVLVFAYVVEISQYFHLANLLGLQNSKLAKILLGTTFSFVDMITYTLGIMAVIAFESLKASLKKF